MYLKESLVQVVSHWCFVWKDFSGYLVLHIARGQSLLHLARRNKICFKEHFQILRGNIAQKFWCEYGQGEADGEEKFNFMTYPHHHAISYS